MMRVLLCFWPLLFLNMCFHREPHYAKEMDKVTNAFTKDMQKDYGLCLVSYGGGVMDDIESVHLGYLGRQKLDVAGVRELYVLMMEGLCFRVNANKNVRPYLHYYPFDLRSVNMSLRFREVDGRSYTDGSVAYVFCCKGKIYYDGTDPETDRLVDLHEESYSEAFRIVRESGVLE